MLSTTNEMPGALTVRQACEFQAQAAGGELYRTLCAAWDAAARRPQISALPTTKREAVAQFVEIAYAFAAAVLSAPADYPAHVVDYATGLLHESLDYVAAETRGNANV